MAQRVYYESDTIRRPVSASPRAGTAVRRPAGVASVKTAPRPRPRPTTYYKGAPGGPPPQSGYVRRPSPESSPAVSFVPASSPASRPYTSPAGSRASSPASPMGSYKSPGRRPRPIRRPPVGSAKSPPPGPPPAPVPEPTYEEPVERRKKTVFPPPGYEYLVNYEDENGQLVSEMRPPSSAVAQKDARFYRGDDGVNDGARTVRIANLTDTYATLRSTPCCDVQIVTPEQQERMRQARMPRQVLQAPQRPYVMQGPGVVYTHATQGSPARLLSTSHMQQAPMHMQMPMHSHPMAFHQPVPAPAPQYMAYNPGYMQPQYPGVY